MTKTFIIAEAGVNHNGDILLAKKMIDVAEDLGADCIKFQSFDAESLVTPYADKAEYQKSNDHTSNSQLEMLAKLEITRDDQRELYRYCNNKKIEFLSSAFSIPELIFLSELGVKRIKVPSGQITDLPYLTNVSKLKLPVILSTGMATLGEIEFAINILTGGGLSRSKISILHCTSDYPAKMADLNLNAIKTISHAFQISTGYSDHSEGIEASIAAVAIGAKIIEKHFTLDQNLTGPDHKASLEPLEFKKMVTAIRNIEKAMGDGIKVPTYDELKTAKIVRKSIVANRDINAGETFTKDNITAKRPGTGISPIHWESILGRVAVKSFKKNELIYI